MKKKILSLLLIVCTFFVFSNVYALEVFEAGESVITEGEYDSSRLVAGNRVDKKSNVDGISFVAGNEVILEGSSTYGLFAGNTLSVKERIEKDLFIAGNGINILEDAVIGRDAYVAGNAVKVSGTIERNLNVGCMSINLSGATIKGDAYIDADIIALDETTVITGKLTYNEDAGISGLDKANVGSSKAKKMHQEREEFTPINPIYMFILSIISSYLVMLVVLGLVPNAKERINDLKYDGNTIFKYLVSGLGVLFLVPFIVLLAVFTIILTPLSLITLAVYAVSVYLASLISSYVVGNILSTKVFKVDNMYLSLAIGIVLVRFLKLIPILGDFVTLICLLFGLGLIFYYIKNKGEKK